MMTFILIGLFIFFILIVLFYQSYWSKAEQYYDCINYENYQLIKESPFSEECSTYEINKKEDQILFRKKGYSLFYIQLKSISNKHVELIGLDGYGMRNSEFKKYICKLVHKIKSKHNRELAGL
ncbi:hypothetical protein [Aquimarina sp. 2201CG5-10]|uniref:hypothetical protein n=1 Tax=Aquimarina callyspongiae TaxID=3098150 RepID=UPI002AB4744B|nr:hypothetical protein [Aquimarina sp. 2201CG5-10]MDY8138103.1 hypothetical protein [Aquimarina sp. 2201CG5-10]